VRRIRRINIKKVIRKPAPIRRVIKKPVVRKAVVKRYTNKINNLKKKA
jgi:hypothetical protein